MSQPLYANLARDLQAEIVGGKMPPGSVLPSEHELAATHGVSRQTVRAALNVLEREGLVERRRGAGTYVQLPRPPRGFGQSVLTTEALINYASNTRRVVQKSEEIVVDKVLARQIGLDPGSRWIRLVSKRVDPSKPERPICVSYGYVDASLATICDYLDDETTALCDLLAQHCGVHVEVIEQEMQGAVVSEEISELIVAPEGFPALQMTRRYRDASGWIFLVSISIHPADRFAYRMKLERSEL